MKYYDPMFYICSEKMPFSIRIEVELKHDIDGGILDEAANTAIKRYPYFAVRLVKKDGDITAVPNDLPVKTVSGELTYPLGSRELNYHVVALSYIGNRISFHITHVITDGAGFSPFINTVLYYYLRGTGIELSSDVYYRALLEQMKQSGIEFVEEGCCPMGVAEIEIPE